MVAGWHFILSQGSKIKASDDLFLPPAIIKYGSTGLLIPLHCPPSTFGTTVGYQWLKREQEIVMRDRKCAEVLLGEWTVQLKIFCLNTGIYLLAEESMSLFNSQFMR